MAHRKFVDLPIQDGDFPWFFVCLPEGTCSLFFRVSIYPHRFHQPESFSMNAVSEIIREQKGPGGYDFASDPDAKTGHYEDTEGCHGKLRKNVASTTV